jgi:AcrR family transcriptional regulator
MADPADRERTWQAGPVRVRVTLPGGNERPAPKQRLTTERIVDTAMDLMATDGYDAVSMRALAKALDTGPASLYQHVANRDELDQLVIERIATQLEVPEPDPEHWDDQLKELMRKMLQLYREHPGSARAAMAVIPTMEGSMRTAEGMMAIGLAGGVSPQAMAWFIDLGSAYVGAIAYEEAVWTQRENSTKAGEEPDHPAIDDLMRGYFASMDPTLFPLVTRYAAEMTGGEGDTRFEFGLDVLVSGLAAVSERYR